MATYAAHHDDHHDDHDHKPHGVLQSLGRASTNHKDIGTLYLIFAFTMFFIGGAMADGDPRRAVAAGPAVRRIRTFFNQMTTMHALVDDLRRDHAGVRRPRELDGAADDRRAGHGAAAHEQLVSFWILPFAFYAAAARRCSCPAARRPAAGRMYPPLVLQGRRHRSRAVIFAVHLMGISSIMGAINIIATILNMRAPGHGRC